MRTVKILLSLFIYCSLIVYPTHGDFHFVPTLLLAVLTSTYTTSQLKTILSSDGVKDLDIWNEFRADLSEGSMDDDGILHFCDQYLRRFANIAASRDTTYVKDENARVKELRLQGLTFGKAAGDGNCLISSLLHSSASVAQSVVR